MVRDLLTNPPKDIEIRLFGCFGRRFHFLQHRDIITKNSYEFEWKEKCFAVFVESLWGLLSQLSRKGNILQFFSLQNTAPLTQSQIAPELKQNWESALGNFKSLVTVDLDVILDLLECKISFQQDQIKFTETVGLNLYIRSNSEVPIKLQEVSVVLSSNKKSKVYKLVANSCKIFKWSSLTKTEELSDEKPATDFILEPKICYKLNFTACQYQFMENVEIEVSFF